LKIKKSYNYFDKHAFFLRHAVFLIQCRTRRDIMTNVYSPWYKVSVILVRFNQLEFSRKIFQKSSYIKFHEYLSSGNWVIPSEQTDRHDKTKSRSSPFFERDYKYLSYNTDLEVNEWSLKSRNNTHTVATYLIHGALELRFPAPKNGNFTYKQHHPSHQ